MAELLRKRGDRPTNDHVALRTFGVPTVGLEAMARVFIDLGFQERESYSFEVKKLRARYYARAGMQLLPVVEPDGASTGRQVVLNCLALVAVGLAPAIVGVSGSVYFIAALVLGLGFLACGVNLALRQRAADARRLLLASLVYLPALLLFMTLDRGA